MIPACKVKLAGWLLTHIDQSLDFMRMHIQRHKHSGSTKRFVDTYASRTYAALK